MIKKTLLIGAVLLSAVPAFASQEEFEAGFTAGYVAGYRHVHGANAIEPIVPIAPLAPLGRDTYQEGFIYGEKAGKNR
jgi:hypothetical protein